MALHLADQFPHRVHRLFAAIGLDESLRGLGPGGLFASGDDLFQLVEFGCNELPQLRQTLLLGGVVERESREFLNPFAVANAQSGRARGSDPRR